MDQEMVEYMDLLRETLPEKAPSEDSIRDMVKRRKEHGFTKCSECKKIAYFTPCILAKGKLDVACDNCSRVFCEHDEGIPRCDHCGSLLYGRVL